MGCSERRAGGGAGAGGGVLPGLRHTSCTFLRPACNFSAATALHSQRPLNPPSHRPCSSFINVPSFPTRECPEPQGLARFRHRCCAHTCYSLLHFLSSLFQLPACLRPSDPPAGCKQSLPSLACGCCVAPPAHPLHGSPACLCPCRRFRCCLCHRHRHYFQSSPGAGDGVVASKQHGHCAGCIHTGKQHTLAAAAVYYLLSVAVPCPWPCCHALAMASASDLPPLPMRLLFPTGPGPGNLHQPTGCI